MNTTTPKASPEITPPVIQPSGIQTPVLADGARDNGRSSDRDTQFVRTKPIEGHEKFEIPPHRRQRGMSYLWASLRVPYSTLRSRRLNDFRAGGYQFVRAADVPELSGYKPDAQVNARFIELGIEDKVQADDPVILDGSVLMMRPEALTKEAEKDRERAARNQLTDHLKRQREESERAIGAQRTQMRHSYEAPDEAPTDLHAEL